MKTLLVLSLIIFGFEANAQPKANAGADQTIYLTQTNIVTLDGSSSSGDSYQWKDISADIGNSFLNNEGHPVNPATINFPEKPKTTVSGLAQGVWYYQLAVTSGETTKYDTCVITVDYDLPPSNGTFMVGAPFDSIASVVNRRNDTVNNLATQWYIKNYTIYFDRGRLNDMYIDKMQKKFYSTIEDGYDWADSKYARAEMSYGYGSGIGAPIDSNNIYLMEWKGYFPQSDSLMRSTNQWGSTSAAVVIWQLHGKDAYSPPFQIILQQDSLYFLEISAPSNAWGAKSLICPYDYLYNKAHTIRIELKEGIGNGAYIKVYLDGVLKYSRTTGTIGRTFQQDYPKFATVYDFDNVLVDASTTSTRNRRRMFSLVTESWKVYTLSSPLNSNNAPTANAGTDQTITLPTSSVTLKGSGSDADGTIASYQWTKISGPSGGTISNPNSASTNVSGLIQGVYQFQLTVTDNKGATGKSTIQVTVNSSNEPPTALAGANQSITLPTNTVNLSGSGSDPDGTISSFLWTKISGPSSYTIANPSSAATNVSGLVQGKYIFQLKVTDNDGDTGTATVQVTVNAAENLPPTANAGSNKTITLPTNTVSLSGSGSDPDGTIISYLWTKISGPSSYNIVNPDSSTTNISGLSQGVYYFQLTVTDNTGSISTATVKVSVNAAENIPPTAHAGSNQTITLPTNSVNLLGSGSDSDGTITSYKWAKISGPSTYNIGSPDSVSTNVTELVRGVYQFQLTVTDNSGDIGTATVQVTVKAAENIPPTAHAGSNKSITLPTNTVTLSGSGNDSDGTITSYKWTKISGPLAYTFTAPNSATTNVTGLTQGVYQFQLAVTDNSGDIGTDNIQVIVNAAPNLPPIANAGSNKSITLPTNSVTLSGSGSDTDGTIASYEWAKISGPATFNIVNENSPVTDITGLVQGVYQFQLTVTDNNGAKGTSNVQVAVNATPTIPPVADAGANQSIILPANTITLSGSGSDADGTITSYNWEKISGPSSYNIVNPASPVTNVSGLAKGVYQFQLTVTDNDGNIGTDVATITVNEAINIPPTANAGSNKNITLPTNSTTLSGSGSDTDGTIVSYQWIKISGPSSYNIVNPSSASTNVSGLVQGVYQFQLTVTDNDGAIGNATVRVTVNAAPNLLPTASAGPNKSITLPTNSISLSGGGSDADGTIVSYQWTKISGPSAYNIVNATSPLTDISGLTKGIYYFQLTVTDNDGGKGTSNVKVTVNAAANLPPTANAGANMSITLPTNGVSLTGSGSDADGTIITYKWTKISGPSVYNIVNAFSPVTDVSGLVKGIYKFQLTVTDNDGDIGSASVQITVNAAPNLPPTANAGSNKNITLPTNSVSLSGSGSDADGTIASYLWTKISGPTAYNIVSPNSASTNVSGLVQGVYQFQLTVKDNKGAAGVASVQVTVNAAANLPPIANAGSNKNITLPTNSVNLSGSGSDADGTIASYLWTKISGPTAYNIVSPNSASTNVSGMVEGIYQFKLTVTDNKGSIGSSTVQVTVNKGITTTVALPNIPPVANAGNDTTIISPENIVILNGSGADADGNIVGYLWDQISGPSSSVLQSNNTAITNANNLIEGTYEFELTVTDNKGAVGKDTVKVTVALARLARENYNLKVYPNPVHDIVNLDINTGKNNTNLLIVITDISGKTVYRQEKVSSTSEAKLQIDMSNLIKGTYVITIFFDGITKQSVKVLRM